MNKIKPTPDFKTEEEMAEFFDTHDFTEYFDTNIRVRPDMPNLKPSTQPITIRLSTSTVRDLKMLANEKDVPYQSLMKVYLDERVKDELRQRRH